MQHLSSDHPISGYKDFDMLQVLQVLAPFDLNESCYAEVGDIHVAEQKTYCIKVLL